MYSIYICLSASLFGKKKGGNSILAHGCCVERRAFHVVEADDNKKEKCGVGEKKERRKM